MGHRQRLTEYLPNLLVSLVTSTIQDTPITSKKLESWSRLDFVFENGRLLLFPNFQHNDSRISYMLVAISAWILLMDFLMLVFLQLIVALYCVLLRMNSSCGPPKQDLVSVVHKRNSYVAIHSTGQLLIVRKRALRNPLTKSRLRLQQACKKFGSRCAENSEIIEGARSQIQSPAWTSFPVSC